MYFMFSFGSDEHSASFFIGHLNYKRVKDEWADPRMLIFLRVHSLAWLQDICRYAADTLL
jgi:hypothetical protein